MLDFDTFEIISFDCYGTLVDWETGILSAIRPVLARHGRDVPAENLLVAFGELETAAEAGAYRPYREVLREVVDGLGRRFGFSPGAADRDALGASLPHWPPFPDTREALAALKKKYRLAVISNIDDDLFALTAQSLGIGFDWVVTAAQVGSYKPSPANFREALSRFGVPHTKVLHVAQSLFHDIAPARMLGLRTVWVNRRRGRPGAGATPPSASLPDVEVADLAGLVRLLGLE
jgi:2-haloacid dehalogenase